MRRPRLSLLLSLHTASCICFILFLFLFSVLRCRSNFWAWLPTARHTEEKERKRSSPCSATQINSAQASLRAIDHRDRCANPLVLPSLKETRRQKKKSSSKTSCRKISGGAVQEERRRGGVFLSFFVQVIVETIPGQRRARQAVFYFQGKSSSGNIVFDCHTSELPAWPQTGKNTLQKSRSILVSEKGEEQTGCTDFLLPPGSKETRRVE